MKKLFLSLAVVFSVAMVSCGGGDNAKQDSIDSATAAAAADAQNQEEATPETPDSLTVTEEVVAAQGDSVVAAAAQATQVPA